MWSQVYLFKGRLSFKGVDNRAFTLLSYQFQAPSAFPLIRICLRV